MDCGSLSLMVIRRSGNLADPEIRTAVAATERQAVEIPSAPQRLEPKLGGPGRHGGPSQPGLLLASYLRELVDSRSKVSSSVFRTGSLFVGIYA